MSDNNHTPTLLRKRMVTNTHVERDESKLDKVANFMKHNVKTAKNITGLKTKIGITYRFSNIFRNARIFQ